MLRFYRLYVPLLHRSNPPSSQDLSHTLAPQTVSLRDVIHRPAEYEIQNDDLLLQIGPGSLLEDRNLSWKANQILLYGLPQYFVLQVARHGRQAAR
jgi:hypothetical protein